MATEDLVQADLALGAHAPAIATLEGLVGRFPLRERLWGLLMVALYRNGRQGDALRTFAKARAVLMEELGVDPGPELARLECDILAHAPTLEWRRAPAEGGPPAPAVVITPERPFGRRLTAVRGPDGRPGPPRRRPWTKRPPGAAAWCCWRANRASARRAWPRSSWPGRRPPGRRWPGAGATKARGRLRSGPGSRCCGLSSPRPTSRRSPRADWRRSLAPLVPEAVTGLGASDALPPLDAESARFRLYEAVMSALTSGLRRPPARRDPRRPPLGRRRLPRACASSSPPASTAPGCCWWAPTVRPSCRPTTLWCRPSARSPVSRSWNASRSAASRWRRSADSSPGGGRSTPSEELVAGLHARTEGNPFFLIELVRLLASEGTLGRADAVAAAQVPAGVRDVLRRRLGRLPEATNALLRVAAVVGRTFDLGVLSAATEYDEDRTLEAVEAALLAGVVVEDPAVGRPLPVRPHPRPPGPVRRAERHAPGPAARPGGCRPRRASRGTKPASRRWPSTSTGRRPPSGPRRRWPTPWKPPPRAQARLAYEAVEAHLGRALELVEGMPAGAERDHLELQVQNRLALSLMMNGGLVSPAAARACDRAAELAVRLGDTRELLSSMAGLSKAAIVRAEWQVVSSLGGRMLALGEASGDPLGRAAGLFTLGNAELFMGDLCDSRRHIEEAIAIARPLWEQSPERGLSVGEPTGVRAGRRGPGPGPVRRRGVGCGRPARGRRPGRRPPATRSGRSACSSAPPSDTPGAVAWARLGPRPSAASPSARPPASGRRWPWRS